ncbi:MAG: hypothetical protein IJE17_04975 [Clostridia bacterium]|nr:hypothetical protein [Clostridia bacterium]
MKYEKCLTCNQLGNTCDGPNFMAMETIELGLWCNEKRKQIPGLTYDKIAAVTGVSKSAVHSFLNGTHSDYRRETFRPIVKLITGGKWDDNPCGNISNSEKAAYEEKIQHLKDEIAWRDDKIQHLTKQGESMQVLITNTNKRNADTQEFFKKEAKRKNRTIAILATFLGLSLAVIFAALVIDRLDHNIGFFWLESLFTPGSNGMVKGSII